MNCDNCRGYPEMELVHLEHQSESNDFNNWNTIKYEEVWKCPICKCEVEVE